MATIWVCVWAAIEAGEDNKAGAAEQVDSSRGEDTFHALAAEVLEGSGCRKWPRAAAVGTDEEGPWP